MGDISATDLIATDLVIGEDEDGDDEGYGDDWWGLAMRIDVERFIAYKNAQLRVAAQTDTSVLPVFENTAAWTIMSEIVSWERSVLRRNTRGRQWPDTMLSPAVMIRDQIDELKGRLDQWRAAFEDADGTDRIRATLQLLPVDFALQQLVADALTAAGETEEARWALLLAVGAASPEKQPGIRIGEAQYAPPRIGWDDRCKCHYTKAQQCVRFGRLALFTAHGIACQPEGQEYTAELSNLRAKQNRTALSLEVGSARRHLTDARKLYKAELAELAKLFEQNGGALSTGSCLFSTGDMSSFRLVLRCGYLGATALLAAAYSLDGRSAEAHSFYDEAIREASVLMGDGACTPRLQRLLAAERDKMLRDRNPLQNK